MTQKAKVVCIIIGTILILIGIIGFFIELGNRAPFRHGRSYYQMPISAINRIGIDSSGNIFFGLGNSGTIQVYDNHGVFIYRFSFASVSGAMFDFYIDNNDIVQVAVARGGGVLYFQDGHLIERRPFIHDNELSDFRSRRRERQFADRYGNTYVLTWSLIGTRFRMYDEYGHFLRTISPRSLNAWVELVFWGFALGIILIIVANKRSLFEFFKNFSELFKDGNTSKKP